MDIASPAAIVDAAETPMRRLLLPLLALGLMGQVPDTVRVALPVRHPDKPLALAAGQRLVVEIRGNATTGFVWEAVEVPPCLEPIGERAYVQDPSDERRLGVGGRYLFTYAATKAGSGALKFVHRRPWEKDQPPVDAAELRVEVR